MTIMVDMKTTRVCHSEIVNVTGTSTHCDAEHCSFTPAITQQCWTAACVAALYCVYHVDALYCLYHLAAFTNQSACQLLTSYCVCLKLDNLAHQRAGACSSMLQCCHSDCDIGCTCMGQ